MFFTENNEPERDIPRELLEYSETHHDESEAVINIALLIMHCDENITNSEIDLLDRIISITKFDKDSIVAQHICIARLKILDVLQSSEQTKEFIERCVMEIKTPVIKHSLVKMAELIANSDNDYSAEEQEIITYLSEMINLHH